MTLELLALQWLRWERKCWLVTLERGICMGLMYGTLDMLVSKSTDEWPVEFTI